MGWKYLYAGSDVDSLLELYSGMMVIITCWGFFPSFPRGKDHAESSKCRKEKALFAKQLMQANMLLFYSTFLHK